MVLGGPECTYESAGAFLPARHWRESTQGSVLPIPPSARQKISIRPKMGACQPPPSYWKHSEAESAPGEVMHSTLGITTAVVITSSNPASRGGPVLFNVRAAALSRYV